jgi:hypothetical protein
MSRTAAQQAIGATCSAHLGLGRWTEVSEGAYELTAFSFQVGDALTTLAAHCLIERALLNEHTLNFL